MSKGTPAVVVRISPALVTRIEAQINSRNLWTQHEPWTFSDFLRIACEEKLRKMRRSRECRRRVTNRVGPELAGEPAPTTEEPGSG